MAVYPPSGSGGAHMDKAISGKKATDPKKSAQVAKKATPDTKTTKAAKKAAPKKEK